MKLISHFDLYFESTLQHIQEQEVTTLNLQPLSLINQDLTSL